MSARVEVLDHGYVELVESWGSDERIVEAARMSTGKGFLGWGPSGQCTVCGLEVTPRDYAYDGACCPRCTESNAGTYTVQAVAGDERLLRYLWENQHATPFEMGGLVVEVQAPIFVFREWHRHRTQSYNELSARYTPLPDVNYVPSVERLMANARGTNRQANAIKDAPPLTEDQAEVFQRFLIRTYRETEHRYQEALSAGVPKELARLHVPVGRYSRMRASANVRNWLAFLTLRDSPKAQWEIRQYAQVVSQLVAEKFPRTHALFAEKARAA